MRCKSALLLASLAVFLPPAAAEDVPGGSVDIPVNIGQSVKDLRVPHHNAEGRLSLRLNAGRAERASTTTFTFNDLRIEIFDEDPEQAALEVVLQEAVFDRSDNTLSSDRSALIRGEHVRITGRRLEFDIASRTSRLAGPVTMTVTSPDHPTP